MTKEKDDLLYSLLIAWICFWC